MLTQEERNLSNDLFSRGPAALLEEGFTMSQVLDFLHRDDVLSELRMLEKEFASKEGFDARSKWLNRRSLSRLAPGAVGVLGQSLLGPAYARDAAGNVMRDAKGHPVLSRPEPTPTQLAAARTILDTLGVGDPRAMAGTHSEVNLTLLVHQHAEDEAKPIKIDTDPAYRTEEERALSRERMRNAIERLLPRLTQKKDELSSEIVKTRKPAKRTKKATTPKKGVKASWKSKAK